MTACVLSKDVGDLPEGTGSDSGSESDTDSESDAGDPFPDSSSSESGGIPAECPDNPGTCMSIDVCGGSGCDGNPMSEYDADGCLRPRCDSDDDCPDGRVCFAPGPYGGCAPSTSLCEPDPNEPGECSCGGTADCNPDVSYCIPEAIVPPPAEVCFSEPGGPAFAISASGAVPPGAFAGMFACTVATIADEDATYELELTCDTDISVTITMNNAGAPPATLWSPTFIGADVDLDVRVDDSNGVTETWVKVSDPDGLDSLFLLGVDASTFLPPGEDATWLESLPVPTSADIGCPTAFCPETEGEITGRGVELMGTIVAPGASAEIAAKFSSTVLDVRQGREGGCDATTDAFYVFSVLVGTFG